MCFCFSLNGSIPSYTCLVTDKLDIHHFFNDIGYNMFEGIDFLANKLNQSQDRMLNILCELRQRFAA